MPTLAALKKEFPNLDVVAGNALARIDGKNAIVGRYVGEDRVELNEFAAKILAKREEEAQRARQEQLSEATKTRKP